MEELNVMRKRVPGGGSSYSKTTRAKACADTWDTNEVYEMERIVSEQSEDRQAEQ